jgi:hypothetical protein
MICAVDAGSVGAGMANSGVPLAGGQRNTYFDFSPETSAIHSQYNACLSPIAIYSHMMAACRGWSVWCCRADE